MPPHSYFIEKLTLSEFMIKKATGQEASSERGLLDDDDVERNADLYIFNHEAAQRRFFTKLELAMRRLG